MSFCTPRRNSIVYMPSSDHNSMWFYYATGMGLPFTTAGMSHWRMLIKIAGSGVVLMNNALVERPQYPWRYANRTEAELRNCSAYVCERITRKRADTNASETMW